MGDYISDYISRIKETGNTSVDYFINVQQAKLNDEFINSPTIVTGKLNGVSLTFRVCSYFNRKTLTINPDSYQKVIFQDIKQIIKIGDAFEFNGYNWLCSETNTTPLSSSCLVERCNYIIKYYNSKSLLINTPCITKSQASLGINETKVMIMGNSKLSVKLPNNKNTIEIKRDKILIVDGVVWKVTDVTKLDIGIIELICEEITPRVGDDMINEIPLNEYAPIIITFLQLSYTKTIGDTFTLVPQITQDNKIVVLSTSDLIWSSSNVGIASVNSVGLVTIIGAGNVIITCSLKDNVAVSGSVNLTCNAIPVVYDIKARLDGSNILKKNNTNTYFGVLLDKDVEVPNAEFDFTITNYTNTNASLIVFTPNVTINSCKIKSLNDNLNASITLRCTSRLSNLIFIEITIELKDIYGN